jgi:hypothetical protein
MPNELDNALNGGNALDQELGRNQRRAVRAAKTEIRRGTRDLKRLGLEDELKPEQTTIDTVFDLLQIGQFTTAGLAQEFQAGGDADRILSRAASEFINALPILSEEDAEAVTGVAPTRPSFSRVLKDEGVGNEWAAAAGGFVLDVALDPTTYVGGAIIKPIAKAAGKGLRRAASTSGGEAVENLLGRAFVPDWELKKMVRDGDLTQEAFDTYKEAERVRKTFIEEGLEDGRDAVTRISANLTEGERRLITEFYQQGDTKVATELGVDVNSETMDRVREFRKFFQEDFEKGFNAGILDESQERLYYLPGRTPQTARGARAWRRMVDERGISERAPEGVNAATGGSGIAGRLGLKDPNFAKGKVYDTLPERMQAGVPTETDLAVLAATKSFETTRAIASRNFGEAMLKNTNWDDPLAIFKRMDPDEFSLLNSQEFLSGFSEKGWVPFNLTKKQIVGKPESIARGDAVYMAPREIAKKLDEANKIFSDPKSVGQEVFDKYREWLNVWKGYAVLSPGFHGRNMFSNWFNNWIGGVVNPKHYTDAYELQRGNFKGKIFGKTRDEFYAEMQEQGVVNRGFIQGDIAETVERDILNDVQGSRAQRMFGQGSPQLKANRAMGRAIENNARIAHYIAKRKEGLDAPEAAMSVKEHLFDYQELTDFERNTLKQVLPFYTWMRKNVPLQVQALVNNSGDVAGALERGGARAGIKDVATQYRNVPKFFDAVESVTEDWNQVPTPDYFQEIHAVRLPIEGAEGTANVFANPNLPFQDLNRLNWRDILSSTTPFAKVPLETFGFEQGHSFFMNRPIERFPEEEGITGLRRKHEEAVSGLLPTIGKGIRMARAFEKGSGVSQLTSEGTGFKSITLEPGRAMRAKTFEERGKIRDILRRERGAGRLR